MNTLFHKILACTMALVVVLSTMSFTVNMHYCGNTLVDVALNQSAKTCNTNMSFTADAALQFNKKTKGCCSDHNITVAGQDELKQNTLEQLTYNQQVFVATFMLAYVNLFEGLPEQIIPFKDYTPPLLVTDINLINETFLI